MTSLPPDIAELADELMTMRGAVAVVLGGSRATNAEDAGSDWDLGLYYRGALELAPLERHGTVYPPGSWGPIMNGGAWLKFGDRKVDVLLRDLDVVEHWSARAIEGQYEVFNLLGYVAGVPTYSLMAERAVAVTLRGELSPVGSFPERLAEIAVERWGFSRRFSLDHARSRAARGDVVGTVGQAAKAIIEEAHAILCRRREWVLNEKRIVERAGLGRMHAMLADIPAKPEALPTWLEHLDALW